MALKFATSIVAALAVGSLLVLAGGAAVAGSEAQEQMIRDLGKKWVAAVAAKDIAAIADIYTADGLFMAPNAPPAQGHEDVGKAWAGLLALPGISLTFEPTRIEVSAGADLAADVGVYALAFDGEGGRVEDQGKYVVVWRKVDGTWKVAADIFNSNLPAR